MADRPSRRTGRLVLVATPIGNLGDLAPRAVETLAAADVIACEDTRRTRALLSHAGIKAGDRLLAVHDHNEAAQVRTVLERLDAGATVAVVTDAGTPGVSDPGERLVAAAAAAGHEVTTVPGPSAAVAALVVSGMDTGRFCFEGFLPRVGAGRKERIAAVAAERRTTVLYESPHRVRRTVADLVAACGPHRRVAVCRELTKAFEEVWRGSLAAAVTRLDETAPRGEYVLVLDGAPAPEPPSDDDIAAALAEATAAGASTRDAASRVATRLGVPKKRVYDLATRR